MYHNHHEDHHHEDHHHDDYHSDDHRYSDHHGEEQYSDRFEEHNGDAGSGEYRADEQYHYSEDSEEHYIEVPLYEEQPVEEPWSQEPLFAEPAYVDPHIAERDVEDSFVNERHGEERYSEERYSEEHYPAERYSEERYPEERYSEERYSEERYIDEPYGAEYSGDEGFRDEHIDDMHYTEHDRDPEIYEYSQDRAGDLLAEDFVDTQRKTRNRFTEAMGKVGITLALALLAVGVAAFTMFASKPTLTPAEIVQMEGYKGSIGRESIALDNASIYREIPAAATIETQNTGNSVDKSNQWSVRQQWSNVREAPAPDSAIVTSLEVDQSVTVIKKIGEWYEITTEDDSSSESLGFIHESLLQQI